MASNTHYSFLKALDLLGLGNRADGRGALAEIALTDHFTLDPEALRSRLVQALDRRERVLTVVSTFGSTEEGSLDDLPAIRAVCDEFEGRGLASWLHVDACYGGYLGAVIRADEGARGQSGAELASWILTFACDFGVPADVAEQLPLRRSDEGHGWLTWDAFASRVAGMAGADSIAIDPHKLGYGAIPGRRGPPPRSDGGGSGQLRRAVSGRPSDTPAAAFTGRPTLEGSRPGAAAAACWLAHRAVPLSQQGHGKVLAASILATRAAARRTRSAEQRATCGEDRVHQQASHEHDLLSALSRGVPRPSRSQIRLRRCGGVAQPARPRFHGRPDDGAGKCDRVVDGRSVRPLVRRALPCSARRDDRDRVTRAPIGRHGSMGTWRHDQARSNGDSRALRCVLGASGRPHGTRLPGAHDIRFEVADVILNWIDRNVSCQD